jgi:hypothetical protein
VKPLPKAFEAAPTDRPFLLPSPLTAGQNVEFALPWQKLHLHPTIAINRREEE